MSTRDCRDVCPLIAIAVKQALEQLGARSREVTVLGASADPHGDIPAAVRRWLATLRMPNNFRYLIGGAEQLQPVWRSHYAAPQPRGNANRAHSASIWLIDRKGPLADEVLGRRPCGAGRYRARPAAAARGAREP